MNTCHKELTNIDGWMHIIHLMTWRDSIHEGKKWIGVHEIISLWTAISSDIWCFMSLDNFLMTLLMNKFGNIVIFNLLLVHPILVYFASKHSIMNYCLGWLYFGWKIYLVSNRIATLLCWVSQEMRKKERKTMMLSPAWNMGVASILSWLKSICNPKTCMLRIRESPTTITSFWRWTPLNGA